MKANSQKQRCLALRYDFAAILVASNKFAAMVIQIRFQWNESVSCE